MALLKSSSDKAYLNTLVLTKQYLVGIFFIVWGLALLGTSPSVLVSVAGFLNLLYGVPEGFLYIAYIICGFWICNNARRRKDINGFSVAPFMFHIGAAIFGMYSGDGPYISLPILLLAVYVGVDLAFMVFPPRLWQTLRTTFQAG